MLTALYALFCDVGTLLRCGHGVGTQRIEFMLVCMPLIHFVCVSVDIVVDNCAICRNHIMDLCK
jgi:hypothetical protein